MCLVFWIGNRIIVFPAWIRLQREPAFNLSIFFRFVYFCQRPNIYAAGGNE